MTAAIRRVEGKAFGKPTHWYVWNDTGAKCPGVTTIIGQGLAKPFLVPWGINTTAEGAVVLGRARLMQVDGIQCEAPLSGHLIYMVNQDVPGVIGHVGSVLGRNGLNIANFSLGRREQPLRPGEPSEAVAVVETDGAVPDRVLAELKSNPAVKVARAVALG